MFSIINYKITTIINSFALKFLCFLFIVGISFSLGNVARADFSFTPPSPQKYDVPITSSCDVDIVVALYRPDGTLKDYDVCPYEFINNEAIIGTWVGVECDDNLSLYGCHADTLTLARSDDGYIGEANYEWTENAEISAGGSMIILGDAIGETAIDISLSIINQWWPFVLVISILLLLLNIFKKFAVESVGNGKWKK